MYWTIWMIKTNKDEKKSFDWNVGPHLENLIFKWCINDVIVVDARRISCACYIAVATVVIDDFGCLFSVEMIRSYFSSSFNLWFIPQASTTCRFSYHSKAALARCDCANHRPAIARHSKPQKVLSIPQGHPWRTLSVEYPRQIGRVPWAEVVQHLNATKFAMFLLLSNAEENWAGENVWLRNDD